MQEQEQAKQKPADQASDASSVSPNPSSSLPSTSSSPSSSADGLLAMPKDKRKVGTWILGLTVVGLAIIGNVFSQSAYFQPKQPNLNMPAAEEGVVELSVYLYSYIPFLDSSIEPMTEMFEQSYPHIKLNVLNTQPLNPSPDIYDPASVQQLLENYADVACIDTILLGEVQALGPLQTWHDSVFNDLPKFFSSSMAASTVGNLKYGVPYVTCSNFGIVRGDQTNTNDGYPPLTCSSIESAWTINSMFLQSYYSPDQPAPIVASWPDLNTLSKQDPSIQRLCKFLKSCSQSPFHNNVTAAFDSQDPFFVVGYSELLADYPTDPSLSNVQYQPAPLKENRPLLTFTDSFVLSKKCSSERCRHAAHNFVKFMTSEAMYKFLVLHQDATPPPSGFVQPRYVMPGSIPSFASVSAINPLFRELFSMMIHNVAFPNHGIVYQVEEYAARLLTMCR